MVDERIRKVIKDGLGIRLWRTRYRHGISQRDAAKMIGISRDTLIRLESGIVKKPHPITLFRVLQFLKQYEHKQEGG